MTPAPQKVSRAHALAIGLALDVLVVLTAAMPIYGAAAFVLVGAGLAIKGKFRGRA